MRMRMHWFRELNGNSVPVWSDPIAPWGAELHLLLLSLKDLFEDAEQEDPSADGFAYCWWEMHEHLRGEWVPLLLKRKEGRR